MSHEEFTYYTFYVLGQTPYNSYQCKKGIVVDAVVLKLKELGEETSNMLNEIYLDKPKTHFQVYIIKDGDLGILRNYSAKFDTIKETVFYIQTYVQQEGDSIQEIRIDTKLNHL